MKKRFSGPQIVAKLRQADILIGQGNPVPHEEEVWMFNERGELIISKLSPKGFEEVSRAKLIKPMEGQLDRRAKPCTRAK